MVGYWAVDAQILAFRLDSRDRLRPSLGLLGDELIIPRDIIRTGLLRFSIRPLIFGSASAALTSRLSRSMISVGVLQAPTPVQPPPT